MRLSPTPPPDWPLGRVETDHIRALRWLQRQLSRFTYKPGWTFMITDVGGAIALSIIVRVRDTYHPDRMIDVGKQVFIPHHITDITHESAAEAFFARFLSDHIKDIEIHESREWLRRDGHLYDDPHAQDARQ